MKCAGEEDPPSSHREIQRVLACVGRGEDGVCIMTLLIRHCFYVKNKQRFGDAVVLVVQPYWERFHS